ncbi:MAG: hypothetical protein RNU03_09940 [Candidatus Sedimenticola sp. (ex Thyasira tokunagai)]
MTIIFFIIIAVAAVTMTPADQKSTAPPPEPVPVMIDKTVAVKCVPLRQGERMERDLTVPFARQHYLYPTVDTCRKKTVTTIVSRPTETVPIVDDRQTTTTSIQPPEPWEPDILKDEEWP